MSVTAEPNTSYFVTNNKAEVVVTLPAEAQPGQVVRVEGFGQGGWKIAQNEKQTVKLGVMPGETWTGRRQMPSKMASRGHLGRR